MAPNINDTGEEEVHSTAEKILGKLSDDFPDGAYLFAAEKVRSAIFQVVRDRMRERGINFAEEPGAEIAWKSLYGFALAAVVEILPWDGMPVTRRHFAQSLRVLTHVDITDGAWNFLRGAVDQVLHRDVPKENVQQFLHAFNAFSEDVKTRLSNIEDKIGPRSDVGV